LPNDEFKETFVPKNCVLRVFGVEASALPNHQAGKFPYHDKLPKQLQRKKAILKISGSIKYLFPGGDQSYAEKPIVPFVLAQN